MIGEIFLKHTSVSSLEKIILTTKCILFSSDKEKDVCWNHLETIFSMIDDWMISLHQCEEIQTYKIKCAQQGSTIL